jgi:hypothetical protein
MVTDCRERSGGLNTANSLFLQQSIEKPRKSSVIQRRVQAVVKTPAVAGPFFDEFAW